MKRYKILEVLKKLEIKFKMRTIPKKERVVLEEEKILTSKSFIGDPWGKERL